MVSNPRSTRRVECQQGRSASLFSCSNFDAERPAGVKPPSIVTRI
jgi:hypothetical protein